MRLLILLACCLPLGQGLTSQERNPRPQFSAYPVKEVYRGEPAKPIITKEWLSSRTMIRRGADSDVEFAGHYTIPRWGCGADCNGFVIVDSINGKIYQGLALEELPFNWEKAHGGDAVKRMEFHPNSRLLKVNACPDEANCGLYDYLMVDGKGLKLIRRQLLPKEFQPPAP